MTRALSVLVVEDDARLREILVRHLDRLGYAVRDAPGGARALQLLEEAPSDVVISDVRMPGIDGRTLLQLSRERFPAVRVVLMTAFGSVDDAVEAMRAGAYSYVTKPFRVEEVAGVLRNAAREVALGREVEGLKRAVRGRFSADGLVGQSEAMQRVRAQLREAARVGSTVLVTGRSGTGKEMAARAIHGEGPRAGGPFVPVNCAAIPEQLFESAMFGHVKGAFTGAHESRPGFLERSSGGTLFLDEVGEIPLSLQPKLLRALQEGEVMPVGATRPVGLDLRVVAATNRELAAMVRDGRFREDLYYRLDVLRIELPALAERPDDVPALAEHLLLEIADEQGAASLGITERALSALARHPWPGNVRELRNALERALLSSSGRAIDLADLPGGGDSGADGAPRAGPEGPGLVTLEELERGHVEKVLAAVGWNRSAAARILGIDRRTLFSKIQRYGLIGPLRTGPGGDADEEG
ncbi:MAG TPA: sigma-54 dependent transcriptional regulator [Anaeromyxobacteraceae bacterium]|nr:sigma-54 dependent transcriptional regulator [Anaeromyxobacteraceae bacterium]